jgi:hypothetical protein
LRLKSVHGAIVPKPGAPISGAELVCGFSPANAIRRSKPIPTGLTVTPLGLGLAALGRPGYINLGHAADLAHDYDVAGMEARAHAALDAAWANEESTAQNIKRAMGPERAVN